MLALFAACASAGLLGLAAAEWSPRVRIERAYARRSRALSAAARLLREAKARRDAVPCDEALLARGWEV